MLTLPQNIYTTRASVQGQWDSKCLTPIAHMIRIFGMYPKVGISSPPQVDTFSVSNTLSLSQEHPLVSENEWCCQSTVNVSNVNFTLYCKNIHTANPALKKWDRKSMALIDEMVRAFGMNAFVWTSLTFQMVTLLQIHLGIYISEYIYKLSIYQLNFPPLE